MTTRRHIWNSALLVTCLAICAILWGCSQESKSHREIVTAYENEEYEETVALCRYAIRRDVKSATVYQYYGMALVHIGRYFEGVRQLEEAIKLAPERKREVVTFLEERSAMEFKRSRRDQGARVLKMAMAIDPTIDPGVWSFYIADTYFREQQYADAAPFL